MKWKFAFAALLLLGVDAAAQERGKPSPDRWHAMVLDRTTPREAVARLGSPEMDSATALLSADPIWRWITKRQDEPVFRSLIFKNPAPGVERVWLRFLDDKLVSIILKVPDDTLSPNALAAVYGADFQPLRDSRGEVRSPRDFGRRAGVVSTKDLPGAYQLAAVTKKSFIVALIGAARNRETALAESARARDRPDFFPGRVTLIQLFSRKLENKEGAAGAK